MQGQKDVLYFCCFLYLIVPCLLVLNSYRRISSSLFRVLVKNISNTVSTTLCPCSVCIHIQLLVKCPDSRNRYFFFILQGCKLCRFSFYNNLFLNLTIFPLPPPHSHFGETFDFSKFNIRLQQYRD